MENEEGARGVSLARAARESDGRRQLAQAVVKLRHHLQLESPTHQHLIVQSFGREKPREDGSDLFTVMRGARVGSDTLQCSKLLDRTFLGRQEKLLISLSEYGGRWHVVLDVLASMMRLPLPLKTNAANAAMAACSRGQQWERALSLLDETRKRRVAHDATSYNIVIAAMEKRQLWEHAMIVLGEMSARRIRPDVFTFNSLMSACAQGLQWKYAMVFFDDMLRLSVQRDIITFNVVISACEKCHQWQQALLTLHEATGHGLLKTHTTFNAAISACDKGWQWHVPLQIFDLMKNEGFVPDIIAFNSSISAAERCRRWAVALLFLEEMMSSEVAFGTVGVRGVVSACEGSGHHGFALTKSISLLQRYTAELLYDRKDCHVGVKRLGADTFPVAHAIDSLHQHDRLDSSSFRAFDRAICARVITTFQNLRRRRVDDERSLRWSVRSPLLDRQFGLGSLFARDALRSCDVRCSGPTWLVAALAGTSRAVASTAATSAPMRHSLAAKSLVTFASYSLSYADVGWNSPGLLVGHGGVEFAPVDA